MRLELEVEKERHSVELEEMAAQLATQKGDGSGGNLKSNNSKDEKKDDISVMSMDDFVNTPVGSKDVNGNDNEDYIKRLEDELEDVTEQLIEAETNISNMESKLSAAAKNKSDLEQKVSEMQSKIKDLESNINTAVNDAVSKDHMDTVNATREELTLITEELTLTQEELKAAQENANVARSNIERLEAEHKAELNRLREDLVKARNEANDAKAEVESMEEALNVANSQTTSLRDEVENLMQALKNAKQDHEKALEDMESLRQAFDDAENDKRESSGQREQDLVKDFKRQLQDLQAEIEALTEANKALKAERTKKSSGPSAAEIDLQIKLDQKTSELERIKVDLKEAKDDVVQAKRKIEELSAGNRALINSSFESPQKRTRAMASPMKRVDFDRFSEEDNNTSDFYRSHARSRTRIPHEPFHRARSSSPTTVVRLERSLADESKSVREVTKERDSLKSQQRMSDIRVQHLETDLSDLREKLEDAEAKTDNLVSVVAGVSENPEAREDKEFMDTEIETLIRDGNKEVIADEFRALARNHTKQKEHNAQLLMRILKLQGNIQVCCRVRPLTNGEIKRGTKRVVEPLSDSEVGVFDKRTKNWKSFAFDKVWGPDSHQLGVFQDVEPLALSVVDGYNSCIFAYGQT